MLRQNFSNILYTIPVFKIRLMATVTTLNNEANKNESTIDEKEVKQHSKFANDWWNPNGLMRGLHSMNQLRVPLIRDGLISTGKVDKQSINSPTPLKGLSILDVGCGGGILTEPLASIGAEVTGLDASTELIDVAVCHAKLNPALTNLTYVVSSIEDYSKTAKEQYDAVVFSEVVEHIQEKDLFIKSCIETLKPGGSVFVTTLNKTYASLIGGIYAAEYILCLLPKGTHDWNKFISPHDLQRILESNGCSTKLVHGMFYNFLQNRWSWMKNTSINYALHAVKCD